MHVVIVLIRTLNQRDRTPRYCMRIGINLSSNKSVTKKEVKKENEARLTTTARNPSVYISKQRRTYSHHSITCYKIKKMDDCTKK